MTFNSTGELLAPRSVEDAPQRESSTGRRLRATPKLAPSTARGGIAKRRLYRRLLADIVQGHLAPGRPLCMRDLARDCGTSTTSVRQVLIELVRDRLVIGSASGYKVAPANQTELLDLTQTACWFAEIGIARIDPPRRSSMGRKRAENVPRGRALGRAHVERRTHAADVGADARVLRRARVGMPLGDSGRAVPLAERAPAALSQSRGRRDGPRPSASRVRAGVARRRARAQRGA